VFWNERPRRLEKIYMHFEEAQYRHLQDTAGMTILREARRYLQGTTSQASRTIEF